MPLQKRNNAKIQPVIFHMKIPQYLFVFIHKLNLIPMESFWKQIFARLQACYKPAFRGCGFCHQKCFNPINFLTFSICALWFHQGIQNQ